MAIVSEYRPLPRAHSARDAGSLSLLFRGLSERAAAAWQRYRVQREVESMSYDQRKDIGFRSADKITR